MCETWQSRVSSKFAVMITYTGSNPLIEELLQLEAPPDDILTGKVLALPREDVIKELEQVLTFLIADFNIETERSLIALHCLFLLNELKSTQSLPLLLKIASQSEDFLDCYFGEHLTETMWQDVVVMGKDNLKTLFNFLKTCETTSLGTGFITDGIIQISMHYPGLRQDIIEGVKETYEYMYWQRPGYIIEDFDWLKILVMDLQAVEVFDTLKLFFDNYRMEGYSEWEEFVEEASIDLAEENDMLSLWGRYEHSATTDFIPLSDFEHSLIDQMFEEYAPTQQAVSNKIGRNEPCPCGSGKKYKRCCINKDEPPQT